MTEPNETSDEDRVYSDPAPDGPLAEAIKDAPTPSAARSIRHQAIVEAAQNELAEQWDDSGVTFVVTQSPTLTTSGLVRLSVLAGKDGELLPGLDNPYLFERPPILVPDGTWRQETQDDGSILDLQNFVENPVEALRQTITNVVLDKARAEGWDG